MNALFRDLGEVAQPTSAGAKVVASSAAAHVKLQLASFATKTISTLAEEGEDWNS